MAYDISVQLISQNRSNEKFTPQGVVIHATDTPGAPAQNEQKYFNSGYRGASAHYFVDWTTIIQCVPLDEVSWGCGPTGNHKFLNLEMCEPSGVNPGQFQETWNRTVWLVAHLCVQNNWTTGPNVWSHRGISNLYHETDHTDPISFLAKYGKTWDDLLHAIDLEIENQKVKPSPTPTPAPPPQPQVVVKEVVKEVQVEVPVKFKNLVLYFGEDDAIAGVYLSKYLNAPLMPLSTCPQDVVNAAEKVYIIGGNQTPNNGQLLSGSDRYDTAIAVLNFIKNGGK